ncbi:MAG: hypothetical protein R3C01_15250, partial [Planctomycetaceae bacterium]
MKLRWLPATTSTRHCQGRIGASPLRVTLLDDRYHLSTVCTTDTSVCRDLMFSTDKDVLRDRRFSTIKLRSVSLLVLLISVLLGDRYVCADDPLPLRPQVQNVPAESPNLWPPGEWVQVLPKQFQQFLDARSIPPDATTPPDAYLFSADYTAHLVGDRLEGEFLLRVRNPRTESRLLKFPSTSITLDQLHWENEPALWGNDPQGQVVVATRGSDGALKGKWSTSGTSSFGRMEYQFDVPAASMTRIMLRLPSLLRLQSTSGIVTNQGIDAESDLRVWNLDLGRRRRVSIALTAETEKGATTDLFARRTTTLSLRGDKVELVSDFDVTVLGGSVPRLQFQYPDDVELSSISYGSDVALPVRLTHLRGRHMATIPSDQFPEGRPVRVRFRGIQSVQATRGRVLPVVTLVGAKLLSSQRTLHIERPLVANDLQLEGCRLFDMRVDSPQLETWTIHDTRPDPKLTIRVGLPGPGLSAQILAITDFSGTLPRLSSLIRLSTSTGTPFSMECEVPSGWDVLAVSGADPGSQSTLGDFRVVTVGEKSLLQIEFRTPFVPGVPREYRIDAIRKSPQMPSTSPLPVVMPVKADFVSGTLTVIPPANQVAEVSALPSMTGLDASVKQQLESLQLGMDWTHTLTVSLDKVLSGTATPTLSFRSMLIDNAVDAPLREISTHGPISSEGTGRLRDQSATADLVDGMPIQSGAATSEGEVSSTGSTQGEANVPSFSPSPGFLDDSFTPTLVDVELVTSLAGTGADHHLHEATFRIGEPIQGRLQFRLPSPALIIGVTVDGTIVTLERRGEMVQFDVNGLIQDEIVIRYRTPVGSGLITESSTVPVPDWGIESIPFHWQIRSSEQRHCYSADVPFGVVLAHGGTSWQRRFFGPLARRQSADSRNAVEVVWGWFSNDDEQPESPKATAGDQTSTSDSGNSPKRPGERSTGLSNPEETSSTESGRANSRRYAVTTSTERKYVSGIHQLDAGATPQTVQIAIARDSRANQLAWCLLFGCIIIGILLRRRRRRRMRRLISSWILIQFLACCLVSDPYAVLCGAGLMGTLIAILLPRSAVFPPRMMSPGTRRAAISAVRPVATAGLAILVLFEPFGLAWLNKTVWSQDSVTTSPMTSNPMTPTSAAGGDRTDATTPAPSTVIGDMGGVPPQPTPNGATTRPATTPDVLIPVDVTGQTGREIYLSPRWHAAYRAWKDRQPVESDWLFRSARYQVHLNQSLPQIEAQYQIQFTRTSPEFSVLIPIDHVTFESVNDCWVDGVPSMVIPSAQGDGVVVRIRTTPATELSPAASVEPENTPLGNARNAGESTTPEPVFPSEVNGAEENSRPQNTTSTDLETHRVTLRFRPETKGTLRDGGLMAGVPRISDATIQIRHAANDDRVFQLNGRSISSAGVRPQGVQWLGPVNAISLTWLPRVVSQSQSVLSKVVLTEVESHPLRFDLRTTIAPLGSADVSSNTFQKLILPPNALISRVLPEGDISWLTERHPDRTELLYSFQGRDETATPVQVEFSIPARRNATAQEGEHRLFPAWKWETIAEQHLLLFKPVAGYDIQLETKETNSPLRATVPRDLELWPEVNAIMERFPGTQMVALKGTGSFSVDLVEVPRVIEQSIDVAMTLDRTALQWKSQIRSTVQGPATPIHRFHLDPRIRNLQASVLQDGAERLHRLERDGDSIILILNSPRNGLLDIQLSGSMPLTPGAEMRLPVLEASGLIKRHVVTIQNQTNWPMVTYRQESPPKVNAATETESPSPAAATGPSTVAASPLNALNGSATNSEAESDRNGIVTKFSQTDADAPNYFRVDPGADAALVSSKSVIRSDGTDDWALETSYRVTPSLTSLSQVIVEIPAGQADDAVLTPAVSLIERQDLPNGATRLILRPSRTRPEFTFRLRTRLTLPEQGEFWESRVPVVVSARSMMQDLILDERFPFRPSSGCSESIQSSSKVGAIDNSSPETVTDSPSFREYRMSRSTWQWVPNPNAVTPLQVPLAETSLWIDASTGVVGTTHFWCISENRVQLAIDLPSGVVLDQALIGTRRLPIRRGDHETTITLPAGVGDEPLVLMWSAHWPTVARRGALEVPRLKDFVPRQQLLTCIGAAPAEFDAELTSADRFRFELTRLGSLFAAFETQSSRTFSFDSPLLLALNASDQTAIAIGQQLTDRSDVRIDELQSLHQRWELQKQRVTFTPSERGASLPTVGIDVDEVQSPVTQFILTTNRPLHWTAPIPVAGTWVWNTLGIVLGLLAVFLLRRSRGPARIGILLARHPSAVLIGIGLFWMMFLTLPPTGLIFVVLGIWTATR